MLDAAESEPGPSAVSDAEGEIASRSRHVAVAIFAMTAAFFLTKTGRDALFFQKRGLFDLPIAYMGMAGRGLARRSRWPPCSSSLMRWRARAAAR